MASKERERIEQEEYLLHQKRLALGLVDLRDEFGPKASKGAG